MKITSRLVVSSFAVALALPIAAFAAKGDRKKDPVVAPSFATVDKNADDAISESEFAAANEKLTAEAAKTQFAQLDKDHDGKLTKAEYGNGPAKEKKKRKKNQ